MNKAKKLNLQIDGMHCAGCASGIEKQMRQTDGIKSVQVNFAMATAAVEYDEKLVDEKYGNPKWTGSR